MDVIKLYTEYLESKKDKWSVTTLRSERYRLAKILPQIDLTRPDAAWAMIKKEMASYSRVTAWNRLVSFSEWLIKKGLLQTNEFSQFRQDNPGVFRNAYERRIPEMGYEEAVNRINRIPQRSREKALQLLRNGLRFTESGTLRNGRVYGKGGKARRVFNDKTAVLYGRSYSTFVRDLATQGLTPHMLRKIAVLELRKKGADVFTLTKFAGWSSITTAQSYAEAADSEVEQLVSKLK